MADSKVLERVQKLLLSAAPTSGGTEEERRTAALMMVELMVQHDLIPLDKPAPERKRKRPPSSTTMLTVDAFQRMRNTWVLWRQWLPPEGTNWQKTIADSAKLCLACKGEIQEGEEVWVDPDHGFMHYERTCADRS